MAGPLGGSGGEVASGGSGVPGSSGGSGGVEVASGGSGPSSGGAEAAGGAAGGSSPEPSGGSGGVVLLPDEPSPAVPEGLVRYLTGNDEDARVTPTGPGVILMGGGSDVTAAFQWWNERIAGGDIVILRTSGADGYNSYLFNMGGADSVETLMVTSRELANSDYVAYRVARAEGIFMAGGDQSTYMNNWKDTRVTEAIQVAYARGAVVGGTSAGLAVLGEFVYAAYQGSITSASALGNPYGRDMTLDRGFLSFPQLAGIVTDSHFGQRDRFGRLLAFVGRILCDDWASAVYGIGVNEATALVVDAQGSGRVLGAGPIYVTEGVAKPASCTAGQSLQVSNWRYDVFPTGSTLQLPFAQASALTRTVSAANGQLTPASPY